MFCGWIGLNNGSNPLAAVPPQAKPLLSSEALEAPARVTAPELADGSEDNVAGRSLEEPKLAEPPSPDRSQASERTRPVSVTGVPPRDGIRWTAANAGNCRRAPSRQCII